MHAINVTITAYFAQKNRSFKGMIIYRAPCIQIYQYKSTRYNIKQSAGVIGINIANY